MVVRSSSHAKTPSSSREGLDATRCILDNNGVSRPTLEGHYCIGDRLQLYRNVAVIQPHRSKSPGEDTCLFVKFVRLSFRQQRFEENGDATSDEETDTPVRKYNGLFGHREDVEWTPAGGHFVLTCFSNVYSKLM